MHRDGGDLLESLEQPLGVCTAMRLHVPDDDVLSGSANVLRGLEHRVGLADTGGSAKENTEAAALGAGLFCLDVGQQLIGIGPYFGHARLSEPPEGHLAGACIASSARFSSSTFTRGSPSHPSNLPFACSAINAWTAADGRPRTRATLAA